MLDVVWQHIICPPYARGVSSIPRLIRPSVPYTLSGPIASFWSRRLVHCLHETLLQLQSSSLLRMPSRLRTNPLYVRVFDHLLPIKKCAPPFWSKAHCNSPATLASVILSERRSPFFFVLPAWLPCATVAPCDLGLRCFVFCVIIQETGIIAMSCAGRADILEIHICL